MAWRRKMRRISALSAYRFERIERPQQALNVFGLAGMDQVQVKGRDRSALKRGGDATNHNELDLMRN